MIFNTPDNVNVSDLVSYAERLCFGRKLKLEGITGDLKGKYMSHCMRSFCIDTYMYSIEQNIAAFSWIPCPSPKRPREKYFLYLNFKNIDNFCKLSI